MYRNWRHRKNSGWYVEFFWRERWGYLGGSVVHWGSYGLEQGNPLKNSKNHSQLPNILFYSRFLVHVLVISRSVELIFDFIEGFWSKIWGSLGGFVKNWGSYGLKKENSLQNSKNHSQPPNLFFLLSFFGSYCTSEWSKCWFFILSFGINVNWISWMLQHGRYSTGKEFRDSNIFKNNYEAVSYFLNIARDFALFQSIAASMADTFSQITSPLTP